MRDDAELLEMHREILARLRTADWPYIETSALEEIVAALPPDPAVRTVLADRLGDRIHGGWHGRIIGNMMGKTFEIGPTRESIREYLESKGAYPLTGYVPFDDLAERDRLGRWGFEGVTAGRVHG